MPLSGLKVTLVPILDPDASILDPDASNSQLWVWPVWSPSHSREGSQVGRDPEWSHHPGMPVVVLPPLSQLPCPGTVSWSLGSTWPGSLGPVIFLRKGWVHTASFNPRGMFWMLGTNGWYHPEGSAFCYCNSELCWYLETQSLHLFNKVLFNSAMGVAKLSYV